MMTRHAAWHMWRLSEAGEDNLGLACSDDGLFIGRTPLIEKRDGQFFVRQQHDIERLLSRAYRTEIRADRLMSGLTSVARALNADDQCLARIAAVHLRIPDIPDRTARDAMEAMDVFVKYARDEGGGDSAWNPALHPRTGTPPNPGWFAPTEGDGESSSTHTAQNDDPTLRSDASPSGNDDWVRLRPGPKRIDELADFIEWIANAKPEDVTAITAEIDRYFKNVGWEAAAKDLKNILAVLTRPGITKEDRQQYLDRLDLYTRVDPHEYLEVFGLASAIALAGGGIPPAARGTRTGQEEASESSASAEARAAEAAAADVPSEVWNYGWARRGREIHDRFSDGSLHPNFPVIDNFSASSVATSIKSIDLNAATYQIDISLKYRLDAYVDTLSEFEGTEFATNTVKNINSRVLQLVIPKGSMTDAQQAIIEASRSRARSLKKPCRLCHYSILGRWMLYKSYLRKCVVYVPTVGKRGGAYADIDPVAVVPVADTEGLRRAFLNTIARKNVPLPLHKGKWPPPVILKYAGVKTWSAFANGALVWNIDEDEDLYQIVGHRMHPDGYWVRDEEQKIEFPLGTSVDVVVDQMIAILQEAAKNRLNA